MAKLEPHGQHSYITPPKRHFTCHIVKGSMLLKMSMSSSTKRRLSSLKQVPVSPACEGGAPLVGGLAFLPFLQAQSNFGRYPAMHGGPSRTLGDMLPGSREQVVLRKICRHACKRNSYLGRYPAMRAIRRGFVEGYEVQVRFPLSAWHHHHDGSIPNRAMPTVV